MAVGTVHGKPLHSAMHEFHCSNKSSQERIHVCRSTVAATQLAFHGQHCDRTTQAVHGGARPRDAGQSRVQDGLASAQSSQANTHHCVFVLASSKQRQRHVERIERFLPDRHAAILRPQLFSRHGERPLVTELEMDTFVFVYSCSTRTRKSSIPQIIFVSLENEFDLPNRTPGALTGWA